MNILITAIGSFSADCVITNLTDKGNKVVGCDIYPTQWHYVSRKCFKTYQVPLATDENYVSRLLDICKIEDIGYIFPLTDAEIDVLNKKRYIFEENNIILCIQSEECLHYARNKFLLSTFFENDKLVNIPRFLNKSSSVDDYFLPAIAKPVNGRSSEGIIKLYSLEDLKNIINKDNYIIQEYLDGNIYTVDYVRDEYGNDFSIPREELIRTKNGAGLTVRVIKNEKLSKVVSYIGRKLNVIGCINLEFICNKDTFYLIDINPRFSAGVAFSNFIGYDMINSHLNCFLHKTILFNIDYKEQIITKHYQEKLLWEN